MMKPRLSIRAGGVLAAVLLVSSVTACGGGSGGSGSASSPGLNGHVITIGFDSALSGPEAAFGSTGKGTIAYLKALNAKGGINGYTFKFIEKDNKYSSSTAVAVARSLAENSFAIVTEGTPPVQGIRSISDQLRIPILGAANGQYFTPPQKYVFGQLPSYARLAEADARFAIKNLGYKNIAFLYQDDDVGKPASQIMPGYVESLGGKLATSVPVSLGTTDFSPFAARLKGSGATAVVSMMAPPLLAGVQKAAVALSYNPKWTGIFSLQDPSYTKSVPASVVANTYSDSVFLPINNSKESQLYKSVVAQYYPTIVGTNNATQGWNFGAVIAAAVTKATSGNKKLTAIGFLNALTTGFNGAPIGFLPALTYDSSQHYGATSSSMYSLTPSGAGNQVEKFMPLPTSS